MNDSILFLALATLFGLGCLLAGWALRGWRQSRQSPSDFQLGRWYQQDETDQAGA